MRGGCFTFLYLKTHFPAVHPPYPLFTCGPTLALEAQAVTGHMQAAVLDPSSSCGLCSFRSGTRLSKGFSQLCHSAEIHPEHLCSWSPSVRFFPKPTWPVKLCPHCPGVPCLPRFPSSSVGAIQGSEHADSGQLPSNSGAPDLLPLINFFKQKNF